jgi:flagellar protein FliO/FliZ
MDSQYLHMIANLVAVLGLMFLVMYLLKKFKVSRHSANQQINIINIMPIGSKEKLILMEVNNALLLVGATPTTIKTLHVFTDQPPKPIERLPERKTFAEQLAAFSHKEHY